MELRDRAGRDLADDGSPAAGAIGVAQAGAVGVDDEVLRFIGAQRQSKGRCLGARPRGPALRVRRIAAREPGERFLRRRAALVAGAGEARDLRLAGCPAREETAAAPDAHGIYFLWHNFLQDTCFFLL